MDRRTTGDQEISLLAQVSSSSVKLKLRLAKKVTSCQFLNRGRFLWTCTQLLAPQDTRSYPSYEQTTTQQQLTSSWQLVVYLSNDKQQVTNSCLRVASFYIEQQLPLHKSSNYVYSLLFNISFKILKVYCIHRYNLREQRSQYS